MASRCAASRIAVDERAPGAAGRSLRPADRRRGGRGRPGPRRSGRECGRRSGGGSAERPPRPPRFGGRVAAALPGGRGDRRGRSAAARRVGSGPGTGGAARRCVLAPRRSALGDLRSALRAAARRRDRGAPRARPAGLVDG
ncbi:MAG: hypothetical protein DWQ36_19355 [Acidobacteria bacterium]|nr:MAG: hypothetical protein DWQ30_06285 [Acidobacteriota bacterium]REK03701.1 MAG: hypothetical protein DWQ36_19355 [Acidobacteriota bacterium]